MSLRTTEVLDKVKAELDAIEPSIGRVHTSLKASAKQEDIITDYLIDDPVAGKVIKAFIIRPGNQRIRRRTLGNNGFSNRFRTIIIDGFMTMPHENPNGADRILEDEFDKVINKLQALNRMEDSAQGDTFNTGEIDMTAIGIAKISNHNVIAAQLITIVQDRFLGS